MIGTWMKTAAAVLLMASTLAMAENQKPDATLEFSGGSVGVGVGVQWSDGTLHYNGKTYPFHLTGISLVDLGAQGVRGTGEVYHLAKIDDFGGDYSAIAAGATVATAGASVERLENTKGVVIQLHSKTQGLELDASARVVAIRLGAAQ